MINGLTWLLLCQGVGEVLVRLLDLPVPGPVVGMVVLLGLLVLRRPPVDAGVLRAADQVLEHLQLLFVPAGVGVVVYLAVLRDEALPLVAGLVASWFLGLVAVGWTVGGLARLGRARAARRAGGPAGEGAA